jgi:hypothetical protein
VEKRAESVNEAESGECQKRGKAEKRLVIANYEFCSSTSGRKKRERERGRETASVCGVRFEHGKKETNKG